MPKTTLREFHASAYRPWLDFRETDRTIWGGYILITVWITYGIKGISPNPAEEPSLWFTVAP